MWTIRVIVIGIVVAVALSQRERRIQQSPLPRGPPSIPGARPAPLPGSAPSPRARIVSGGTVARRRLRPVVKTSPFPSFPGAASAPLPPRPAFANAAPSPLPPRPAFANAAPAPAPKPLLEEDFDYLEGAAFDDNDFLLPSRNTIPKKAPQSAPQAFRPVEIKPQFRAQAPAPAPFRPQSSRPQQQASAPRRAPQPSSFRQEFNLRDQQQQPGVEAPRGTKEPEVQIIKSWSNRNSDGTFSWGYLNTDGSFKNETKGTDCVVRGVYGYIDQETGETLSFPYESGNPCDPNAPDYFFDYEDGTLNVGGQVIQRAQLPTGSSRRRLQ